MQEALKRGVGRIVVVPDVRPLPGGNSGQDAGGEAPARIERDGDGDTGMLGFVQTGEVVVQLARGGGVAPALGRPPGKDDRLGGVLRVDGENGQQHDGDH